MSGKLKTLDIQIRKGFYQTNNGGVLVDISGSMLTDEEAINAAIKRSWQTGGMYVIIIRDNELTAYICREQKKIGNTLS